MQKHNTWTAAVLITFDASCFKGLVGVTPILAIAFNFALKSGDNFNMRVPNKLTFIINPQFVCMFALHVFTVYHGWSTAVS